MQDEKNEIFDTLKDVVVRLNDLGVNYMVTGSVAMASYVKARATMDVDVIVEIEEEIINNFEQRFAGDYYVTIESIRRAKALCSMFNVISQATFIKVDFILRKPNRFETAKFERRRLSKLGELEFWVISKEDLILSKLDWAKDSLSERQFEDVRALLESGADTGLIDREINAENLVDVWRSYLEWKIRIEK